MVFETSSPEERIAIAVALNRLTQTNRSIYTDQLRGSYFHIMSCFLMRSERILHDLTQIMYHVSLR